MHGHRKIPYVAVFCLALAAQAAACRTAEPARLRADDASITAKIKRELASDSDLNPFNIDVTTKDRVVTLRGRVKTEDAREKAERFARQTDGVERVVNLVKVGDQQ